MYGTQPDADLSITPRGEGIALAFHIETRLQRGGDDAARWWKPAGRSVRVALWKPVPGNLVLFGARAPIGALGITDGPGPAYRLFARVVKPTMGFSLTQNYGSFYSLEPGAELGRGDGVSESVTPPPLPACPAAPALPPVAPLPPLPLPPEPAAPSCDPPHAQRDEDIVYPAREMTWPQVLAATITRWPPQQSRCPPRPCRVPLRVGRRGDAPAQARRHQARRHLTMSGRSSPARSRSMTAMAVSRFTVRSIATLST